MDSRKNRLIRQKRNHLKFIRSNTIRFNSHTFEVSEWYISTGKSYEFRCKHCNCYIYAEFDQLSGNKVIQCDHDVNTLVYKSAKITEILESKRTFACKDFRAEIDAKDILE